MDLNFLKAEIDPNLIKLQIIAKQFITEIIVKHENIIYKLIPPKNRDIITTTNKKIIDLIFESTNTFFNRCYMDIQNGIETLETQVILEMSYYAKYSPHILLNKLIHATLDMHIDIVRENLCADSIDEYNDGINEEINYLFLSTVNLIHVLSKGNNDNEEFIRVADNEKPFSIVIEKHIE